MRIQSKIVVGYDLGNDTSQISYSYLTEEEVITLYGIKGNIPTQLCKKIGRNQWYFGEKAKQREGNEDVIIVNNIWQKALSGDVINVDNAVYDAKDLLTQFVKESLKLLNDIVSIEQIQLLVITVDELDERAIQLLDQVVAELPIRKHITMYQSKEESFFHYIVESRNMYTNQALFVDGTEKFLKILHLELNQSVSPIVG
ncbi:MAG: DUF5716 family protein, partial [Eubacteriales bacterium]